MASNYMEMSGAPDFLGLEHDETRGIGFRMSASLIKACAEVNRGRVTFRISQDAADSFGDRFDTHPDRLVVEKWLAAREADADEVLVIRWLCNHVVTEWNSLPKRTATQHRDLFGEVAQLSNKLADLIRQTGSSYYRGGGHGLQGANIGSLLTDSEEMAVSKQWQVTYTDDGHQQDPDFKSVMPTFEDLLARVATAAKRLAASGPVHAQPNKRGAERGYFVRGVGQLFEQRYKTCPAEVIAALTTVALNEVTDRELVSKLLK